MKKIRGVFVFLIAAVLLSGVPCAHAGDGENIGYASRGVSKIVGSLFAIPRGMLQGAGSSFPFGIVTGAIRGTFETVSGVVSGTADVARGSAPYAKYAALAAV